MTSPPSSAMASLSAFCCVRPKALADLPCPCRPLSLSVDSGEHVGGVNIYMDSPTKYLWKVGLKEAGKKGDCKGIR